MRRVEVTDLQYFIAVAEELNFRRAAQRLHISPPPLSRRIAELEALLGVTLLERSTRSVEVTVAGHRFLARAYQVLEQIGLAIEEVQSVAKGYSGILHVGFVGSAALDVLPTVLITYRRTRPGVQVKLAEMSSDRQHDALALRQLDIGLSRIPPDHADLEGFVVARTALVAAVPSDHRLARRERVSPAELADEPFVLFPRRRGRGLFNVIEDICLQHGFYPNVVQEVFATQTAINLVAAGLGISIVPASANKLRLSGVRYLDLEGDPYAAMYATIHKQSDNPALHEFLHALSLDAADGAEGHRFGDAP